MESEGSSGLLRPGSGSVGADALLGFLERAAVTVAFECLAVLPVDGCTTVAPGAVRHLYQQILARGVRIRTLYPESARDRRGVQEYARWTVGLGAAVRTGPALPPNMFIFDRELVLLPQDQGDRSKGSVLVTDDCVVSALCLAFEQAWRIAAPLGGPGGRGAEQQPTEAEQRLLRLLSTGSTDESAGKQLGMSLRTVRRMTARLMDRLDAVSRFEAGCKATRRGWL